MMEEESARLGYETVGIGVEVIFGLAEAGLIATEMDDDERVEEEEEEEEAEEERGGKWPSISAERKKIFTFSSPPSPTVASSSSSPSTSVSSSPSALYRAQQPKRRCSSSSALASWPTASSPSPSSSSLRSSGGSSSGSSSKAATTTTTPLSATSPSNAASAATRSSSQQNKLKGIIYAEFDIIAGPKITYQYPPNVFSQDAFEAVSDYIITKPQVSGKLLSINVFQHVVMGYPVCLEHPRFDRNAFLFNLCFLFDQGTEDLQPYEMVIKKLANTFIALECESQFLSQRQDDRRLREVIEQIYSDLNNYEEATIPINEANVIRVKLFHHLPPPPEVHMYQVPVQIKDMRELYRDEIDLTVRMVIPWIDGIRHVKKIAKASGVHPDLVVECLRHLLYYKCIVIVDVFQYSNEYHCTPQIYELAKNRIMQKECLRYITITGRPMPKFSTVMNLYCALRPGLPLRQFCQDYQTYALNIDDRCFITFGVINGLIRRIHKYPLYSSPNMMRVDKRNKRLNERYLKLFDGKHCFDEICCELDMSHDDVQLLLEREGCYVVISK